MSSATWVERAAHELQRQRCKVCWNADGFDFHVPDAIWAMVVPQPFREHVVCLACFDAMANVGGIDYAPHVTTVYFAGDQAAFELRVVRTALVIDERLPAVAGGALRPALIAELTRRWWLRLLDVVRRRPLRTVAAKVPGVSAPTATIGRCHRPPGLGRV